MDGGVMNKILSRLRAIVAVLTLAAITMSGTAASRNAPASTCDHQIINKTINIMGEGMPDHGIAQQPEWRASVLESYGKLPLSFEPNQGQTDPAVKFLTRAGNYQLFLTAGEAILRLSQTKETAASSRKRIGTSKSSVVKMKLLGSNLDARAVGEDPLEGKSNYLIGNDRSKWQTDIPTFNRVRFIDVWPGIDQVWYGNKSILEYDFIVKPAADLSRIRIQFAGPEQLSLDGEGNLIVKTGAGEITHRAPVVYQETEQGRNPVAARYTLKAKGEIGFEIGTFDRSRPLVIDPQLIYSTYVGGSGFDAAKGVAADDA